jgi:hypothetical protein
MNQAQMQELYQQYFYYIIVAGVLIGTVLGAIPFFLALKRKKKGLGWSSLIVCAVAGGFSPLLAAIVAVIFTVVVLKAGPASNTADDDRPE